MEKTKEVSRKEFLEGIPQFVFQNVRLFLQGRLICSDGETDTSEDSADIKAKVARLDVVRCLAWGGLSCQSCYLACPLRDKAIILDDQRPVINILFCNGCSRCVAACQAVNDRPALKMAASRA